jgi:hypothetical protein
MKSRENYGARQLGILEADEKSAGRRDGPAALSGRTFRERSRDF